MHVSGEKIAGLLVQGCMYEREYCTASGYPFEA
jgi:hypothetical protein